MLKVKDFPQANPLSQKVYTRYPGYWIVFSQSLATLILLFATAVSSGQEFASPNATLPGSVVNGNEVASGRHGPEVLEMIMPVAEPYLPVVVEIYDAETRIALGTLLEENLVVTKASELPASGQVSCVLNSGETFNGTLLGAVEESDLAFLKIEPPDSAEQASNRTSTTQPRGAVTPFAAGHVPPETPTDAGQSAPDTSREINGPESGTFVISVFDRATGPMLGTVSIKTDSAEQATTSDTIPDAERIDAEKIDLGIECQPVAIDPGIYRNHIGGMLPGGQLENDDSQTKQQQPDVLLVDRVYPRSIAETAGLLVEDVILKFNGMSLDNAQALQDKCQELVAGQRISITILRKEQAILLETRVPRHSRPIFHDRWGGGPFSRRRFNFPTVITHDTPLHPELCGGPVIDLQGNLIGINIARSLRVSSLALPIEYIRQKAAEAKAVGFDR